MGTVVLDMAMSLDGFAADEFGNSIYPVEDLHSDGALELLIKDAGAVVMGRRAYDMAQGDFTGYEYQVPVFVLTHRAQDVVADGQNNRLRFHFVTSGVVDAVSMARRAAGDKNVMVIGGPRTFRQCIDAGLADELLVRLVPVLTLTGLRLFGESSVQPSSLTKLEVRDLPGRTDFRFRMVKAEVSPA